MALTAEAVIRRVGIASDDIVDELVELGESAINSRRTVVNSKLCRTVTQRHMLKMLIRLGVLVPCEIDPVEVTPHCLPLDVTGYWCDKCNCHHERGKHK